MALLQRLLCDPKANRAFSGCNTGQARSGCQVSECYKVPAILSEAECNSRVARAWRLHLIMCGVVTPDHSQPSPSLTTPIQPIQQYAIRLLILQGLGSFVDELENKFTEQKHSSIRLKCTL